MKYMSYIFENQDLRQTVANNEALVEMASSNVVNYNLDLESYVYENLAQFTAGANELVDIYENVRNFIISENTALYSQLSEILADSQLTSEEKAYCLQENFIEKAKTVASHFLNDAKTKVFGAPGATRKTFEATKDSMAYADHFAGNSIVPNIAKHVGKNLTNYKIGAGVAGAGTLAGGSYAADQHFNGGQLTDQASKAMGSGIDKAKSWLPGHGISSGEAGAHMTPNPISGADGIAADPGMMDRMKSMGAEAAKQAQLKGAAAVDFAKSQANSIQHAALDHPHAAAAIGAGVAGAGAYGAYRAIKSRKQS